VFRSVILVGARDAHGGHGAGTIVVPDSARMEGGRWVATVLDTVPVWRVEQSFGGVSIVELGG
jgi:hypothetical protein